MTEVDNYHWHELLHGISLVSSLLDNVLHRGTAETIIRNNPSLSISSDLAEEFIYKLYQEVGILAPHMSEINNG